MLADEKETRKEIELARYQDDICSHSGRTIRDGQLSWAIRYSSDGESED